MAQIPFTKGHGTGNDFVVILDPDGALDLDRDQVAALCDRHFGIGADGLLRVVRSSAIAEGIAAQSAGVEWFMDYRNADGSVAEMCGNGTRVFAKYLVDSGLASIDDGLRIGTRAGIKTLTRVDGGFEVDLGPWTIGADDVLVRTRGGGVPRPGMRIDLGNPHVVVALATGDELDGLDLGYQPILDPAPAAGANVEFVVPSDPLVHDGVGTLRMRVFERGSGETLSCGTGVAASALAVRSWAGPAAPDRWRVEVPGGVLGLRIADVEGVPHAFLSGPASLVFSGEVALA